MALNSYFVLSVVFLMAGQSANALPKPSPEGGSTAPFSGSLPLSSQSRSSYGSTGSSSVSTSTLPAQTVDTQAQNSPSLSLKKTSHIKESEQSVTTESSSQHLESSDNEDVVAGNMENKKETTNQLEASRVTTSTRPDHPAGTQVQAPPSGSVSLKTSHITESEQSQHQHDSSNNRAGSTENKNETTNKIEVAPGSHGIQESEHSQQSRITYHIEESSGNNGSQNLKRASDNNIAEAVQDKSSSRKSFESESHISSTHSDSGTRRKTSTQNSNSVDMIKDEKQGKPTEDHTDRKVKTENKETQTEKVEEVKTVKSGKEGNLNVVSVTTKKEKETTSNKNKSSESSSSSTSSSSESRESGKSKTSRKHENTVRTSKLERIHSKHPADLQNTDTKSTKTEIKKSTIVDVKKPLPEKHDKNNSIKKSEKYKSESPTNTVVLSSIRSLKKEKDSISSKSSSSSSDSSSSSSSESSRNNELQPTKTSSRHLVRTYKVKHIQKTSSASSESSSESDKNKHKYIKVQYNVNGKTKDFIYVIPRKTAKTSERLKQRNSVIKNKRKLEVDSSKDNNHSRPYGGKPEQHTDLPRKIFNIQNNEVGLGTTHSNSDKKSGSTKYDSYPRQMYNIQHNVVGYPENAFETSTSKTKAERREGKKKDTVREKTVADHTSVREIYSIQNNVVGQTQNVGEGIDKDVNSLSLVTKELKQLSDIVSGIDFD